VSVLRDPRTVKLRDVPSTGAGDRGTDHAARRRGSATRSTPARRSPTGAWAGTTQASGEPAAPSLPSAAVMVMTTCR